MEREYDNEMKRRQHMETLFNSDRASQLRIIDERAGGWVLSRPETHHTVLEHIPMNVLVDLVISKISRGHSSESEFKRLMCFLKPMYKEYIQIWKRGDLRINEIITKYIKNFNTKEAT